jgi:hypothetical protein
LENDPLIREYADRVYCINYDDHPEGFLAGLYTSLEHPFFDVSRHRIWPLFVMNNQAVYQLTTEAVFAVKPRLMFSFTGAASHEIRKKIFKLFSKSSKEHHVEHINKWYNHADEDRKRFVAIALDSAFCLCPHGYCAYTHRITEVMAMGRVPVIIADDWIPFSFDEEVPYYIRVLEKDIEHLPEILSGRRGEAEGLGRNARALWEKYFSERRRSLSLAEAVKKLSERTEPRMSYEAYRERWNSRDLLRRLGWTTKQQVALRLEQHARRFFPTAKIPGVSPLMRYRNAPNLK